MDSKKQNPSDKSERRDSNSSSHTSSHRSNSHRGSSYRKEKKADKKRKRAEEDQNLGMGPALSALRQPDLPVFNLTSISRPSVEANGNAAEEKDGSGEWQTVENSRPSKRAKKTPQRASSNYPAITFSPDSRLQSSIKISDLQDLVLYLQADGKAPQFVSVRHRPQFKKVVVLMVPGLEKDMFIRKKKEQHGSQEDSKRNSSFSPDDFYPVKLSTQDLPKELEHFQEIFEYAWPVQTPGDEKYNKMHSPLHAMLTAPAPRVDADQKNKKKPGPKAVKEQGFVSERTRITEYLCSIADLAENDYVLHPAMHDDQEGKALEVERRKIAGHTQADDWVDTEVDKYQDGSIPEMDIEQGSLTAGRTILAMDCEMCMTGPNEFSLTRISIVAWDGSVIMDELVKPAKPIIDYLTQYSGITKEKLENVSTTLEDIQQKLVTLLTPHTILIGHSLNSDLTALKITHPYIIDTALIYPHPRGPPLKQGLKFLAQKFLNRAIQAGHGTVGPAAGHDSIEDARTCLDLVKQKCEKGKAWGNNETGENLFRRLARSGVKYKSEGDSAVASLIGGKTSAAIDWGDPRKGPGAAATVIIGCQSDEDVVAGVRKAVLGDVDGKEVPGGGVEFVWARFRELESLKGWWNENRGNQNGLAKQGEAVSLAPSSSISEGITSKSSEAQPDSETPNNSNSSSNNNPPDHTAKEPISALTTATAKLTSHIRAIYDFLPPCTAFIVYSGSGDPRELGRLQGLHATWKREYRSKKWDELSVKWTDVEEQALKRAARSARKGVGFVGVK